MAGEIQLPALQRCSYHRGRDGLKYRETSRLDCLRLEVRFRGLFAPMIFGLFL